MLRLERRRALLSKTSMRPRRARLGCFVGQPERRPVGHTSMRPRRARLGCPSHFEVVIAKQIKTSMRPRRARLGCRSRRRPDCGRSHHFNEAEARAPRMHGCLAKWGNANRAHFNEAEARAPRMQPPYKPLNGKAISPHFRAVARNDRRSLPVSTRHRIDHVKERHDSNNLPRFERVWGFARRNAARKRPASTKHV